MGDYAKALGSKLRGIRQQQGLSLHGVEQKSGGRWKAVVVGSYERLTPVTVQKLAELADFYGSQYPNCYQRAGYPPGRTSHQDCYNLERLQQLPVDKVGPGSVCRHDPEPARRLQRQGAVHPHGGPALAGDHLRHVAGDLTEQLTEGSAASGARLQRKSREWRSVLRGSAMALIATQELRGSAASAPSTPLTNRGESSVDSDWPARCLVDATASSTSSRTAVLNTPSGAPLGPPRASADGSNPGPACKHPVDVLLVGDDPVHQRDVCSR